MDERRARSVRSYRDVVDVVERRIFRIDRWRIPHPAGVPVVAVGYFAAIVVCVLVASKLPLIGGLLGALQPGLRLICLPALGAWALVSWQVDGRRPHHVLVSLLRYLAGPRTVAGLRRVPAVGSELVPLEVVQIAPCGEDPAYRPGKVRGPATVILRHPARLAADRRGARRGETPTEQLARSRRIRVESLQGPSRSLLAGQEIRVPEGSEVVFE